MKDTVQLGCQPGHSDPALPRVFPQTTQVVFKVISQRPGVPVTPGHSVEVAEKVADSKRVPREGKEGGQTVEQLAWC